MKSKLLKLKWLRVIPLLGALVFMSFSANGQDIRGKVTDETGSGIVGANIVVKGTTNGTITDLDGNYNIKVNNDSAVLIISFMGYQTQEIQTAGKSEIDVQLMVDTENLDEVVVIGYGTVRKSDLTGSVGSVKAEELTQLATTDVVEAMQGRVAGVQISSNSGEPGGGMKIRIRGTGTINNSDPLYVVDGFPTNDLSAIAPNDIESMEVLKDASATAIYGSRGANGVVMITTKSGKAGKTTFNFSSYAGVQTTAKTIDMLNASEYATLRLEAYENDGSTPGADIYDRLVYARDGGYKGTNWQDEIFRPAPIQSYNLSVQGGNENHIFNLSTGYFQQDGIIKNSGLKKIFARFNNEYNFNKWLKGGVSINYANSTKNNYNSDLYNGVLTTALRADPLAPAWDVVEKNWGRADLSYNNNPARIVDESKYDTRNEHKVVGNIFLESKIMEPLTFRTQFGVDAKFFHNKIYRPEFFVDPQEQREQSELFEQRGTGIQWVWSGHFNYLKEFGDHNVNFMAGAEAQSSTWDSFQLTAYNIPSDENLHYFNNSKELESLFNGGKTITTLMSYFGRANYNYLNKYLFTGTVRYDGSSKFLGDNKWGIFPSFSLGWNAKEESFLQGVEFLSNFKIRGGWGQVGNEATVGPYSYVTTVSNGNRYVFNDQLVEGIISTDLSNPELKWETTTSTNVGLDLSFFNHSLSFTADYFIKKTSDMIVYVPIPDYVGAGAPAVNAGDMQNTGFEFALGYKNSIGDFKYDLGFNMTFIKNEVTSLGGGEPIESGGISKVGNTTRTEVGHEIAYFYGLETDGIFNTQAELDAHVKDGVAIQPSAQLGDVKFLDANNDGKINGDDRVKLGSATPDFYGAFNANFEFKGFDLRVLLQGTYGNEVVNSMTRFNQMSSGWENSVASRMDRWTPANPNSNEPRMTDTDANRNIEQFSDRYVEDGSFIRVKNLQLGYNLPKNILENIGISSLRIYVSVDNLYTFTKYKGYDPEVSDLFGNPLYYGIDMGNYPQARTFLGGLTINF